MKRHSCVWLFLLPVLCPAAELPQPQIPQGVGVNIHFVTGHEKDLDLIAAAGFRFIRMDFAWTGIEREKGQYHWEEYEQLLAQLDRRGIRAVFILDYSNPLYEPEVTSVNPLTHALHRTTSSPQHPESIAAFARWAAAAVEHFKGRHVLWELWNEPNIDFWSPKPDVHQYTTLALAACKAIRRADPQATIVGPATSGFPWDFLETFLKSGVLEYLDAVSVHPYREPRRGPETAAPDYKRLRDLVDRYAPRGKRAPIPILSGEWGYSSWQGGVSLDTQAAFLVRQQLVNLLNRVPLSIWYDWKNDGADPKENEQNFGTVSSDLAPKPAYHAVQTLTHELTGFRIAQRQHLPSDQDYLLVCTNSASQEKWVAWTTGEPHLAVISVQEGVRRFTGTSASGEPIAPRFQAGQLSWPLGKAPSYLAVTK